MVDDDALGDPLLFARPVQAMHAVSRDVGLDEPLPMADGTSMTALEMQWHLLGMARTYAETHGLEAVGAEVGEETLVRWESVLSALEADPMQLADQLDWVAKYRLFDGYRQRHGLEWTDARLAAMDLQYHDLRPGSSLARRVGLERLTDDEAVAAAVHEPPRRHPCVLPWAVPGPLRR